MGDEGFAAGGLLTKPKYGSYAAGGEASGTKHRKKNIGPAGMTYTKAGINNALSHLIEAGLINEENVNKHIVRLGNGKFKLKNINLAHGGEVNDSILCYETGGMTDYGKSVMTKYYHPFENKRERDEAVSSIPYARGAKKLGSILAKIFGLKDPDLIEADMAGAMRHDPDLVYRSGRQ